MDLCKARAVGAHLKSKLDAWGDIWIRNPAIGDVWIAIAPGADRDGLAFEAYRWSARHAAVFEYEISETALGIGGCLAALFFIADVNKEFDDATVLTIGNGICDGVDDDVAIA